MNSSSIKASIKWKYLVFIFGDVQIGFFSPLTTHLTKNQEVCFLP